MQDKELAMLNFIIVLLTGRVWRNITPPPETLDIWDCEPGVRFFIHHIFRTPGPVPHIFVERFEEAIRDSDIGKM